MKILFIAIPHSIHTARWINQINKEPWNIFVYPSFDINVIHSDLDKITFIHPEIGFYKINRNDEHVIIKIMTKIKKRFLKIFYNLFYKKKYIYQIKRLEKVIKKIKPDIIHSLETQMAGYLTYEAIKIINIKNKYYKKWIHSVWGSDIYLFSKFHEHKTKIVSLLDNIDFLWTECNRDILLAKDLSFHGKNLPIVQATGGFNFDIINPLKELTKQTSKRNQIMLKGYQGWAGRALIGLIALEKCLDLLKNFTIYIYSCFSEDIKYKVELLNAEYNIPFIILPNETPHIEILKKHGESRISIGLSISDGIPNSLLEAMVMGSFPIQSSTSAANEIVSDKKNGLLVPPEDIDAISVAIREAILDDRLVDDASIHNWDLLRKQMDYNNLKDMVIDTYKKINNEEI